MSTGDTFIRLKGSIFLETQNTLRPLSESKRIVVKVGTSTLTHRTGRMNLRRFHNLVRVLADLSNAG